MKDNFSFVYLFIMFFLQAFQSPISLQPNVWDIWYLKLWIHTRSNSWKNKGLHHQVAKIIRDQKIWICGKNSVSLWKLILSFLFLILYTLVGDYINTIKTNLISIMIYIKLLNSMDTQKHRSQEKLSIKNGSLWLLVITFIRQFKKILFVYLQTCNS